MKNIGLILKSRTFWGTVLTSGAWLATQPHIGITEIIQAGGAVVAAAGVRSAIAENGTGQ